ncbi:MAG: HAD family hydrolase [Christensenellales bacterium]
MMKKKAVVFDLDGTLLNTLPDIAAAMNKALREQGLPAHEERAYRLFTGEGAATLTRRALGPHPEKQDAVLAAYAREYAANSRVHTAPYPGVPGMLSVLHEAGLRLCVLSNKDDQDAKNVVSFYFPGQVFAAVRGRVDGVPLKPDPTALLDMIRSLGLAPSDIWYVGDTGTDMRCARNAGAQSIAVTWGFQTREEIAPAGPLHYADTAEALQTLLLA